MYNADIDPHDRLRPCHLSALKDTINHYANMLDNAIDAFFKFATRPGRILTSDSENTASNSDCGHYCVLCSCGDIVLRGK